MQEILICWHYHISWAHDHKVAAIDGIKRHGSNEFKNENIRGVMGLVEAYNYM